MESVSDLDIAALRAWYTKVVRPEAMSILIVGDVRTDRLRAAVEAAFGEWRAAGAGERATAAAPAPSHAAAPEIAEQRARRQTAFALGFHTAPFGHEDQPVLDVIQSLTSGLAGRFGIELRGRQSLAYVTGSAQVSRAKGGFFFGYLAGQHDKEARAREAMQAEFARLAREAPPAAELETAKSGLAGAAKIRLQSNAAQAGEMMRNLLLAGDAAYTPRYLERIAAVTATVVQRVAARYFAERPAVGVLRGGEAAASESTAP
jgi:zinc protease